jgi:hypothetical protein
LLTIDCYGTEIVGFLDAVPLFRLEDDSLEAGGVGLASNASAGARVSEVRVAAPVWSPFYAFGREAPLAAGTRVVISSGNEEEATSPSAEPNVLKRFAAAVGESGGLRLPPNRADLRVAGPGRSTGHSRRFVTGAVPVAVKVLRKADGTALAILPAEAPTLEPRTYRLSLAYHRDLGDPLSRLSQEGRSEAERVRIDIPPALVVR